MEQRTVEGWRDQICWQPYPVLSTFRVSRDQVYKSHVQLEAFREKMAGLLLKVTHTHSTHELSLKQCQFIKIWPKVEDESPRQSASGFSLPGNLVICQAVSKSAMDI